MIPRDSLSPTPVGLIAGAGRFPILFAEKAKSLGIPVICIGITGMAHPELAPLCTRFYWLNRMSLGFVFRKLRKHRVEHWTMAGKFHKVSMFGPFRWFRMIPDWRALRFWYHRIKSDRRDDPILLALIEEFRLQGLECVSALDICPELLVRAGLLTRRAPTPSEELDIAFGWKMAKEMGRLDIGQSVMIREGVVLAVEAIEGTDLAILRAGELSKKTPFVVVKVAKPQQDSRFDVPTIGEQTILSMVAAGAKVLAIEAERTIILDEANTIASADRHGITIQSLSGLNEQETPVAGR